MLTQHCAILTHSIKQYRLQYRAQYCAQYSSYFGNNLYFVIQTSHKLNTQIIVHVHTFMINRGYFNKSNYYACMYLQIHIYLFVHRVESPHLISVVLKIFERNLMWSVFTLCKLFYLELHVSWSPEWMEEVMCARVRAQHRPPWQQQAAPTLTKWRGQPGAGTRAALGQHRSSGTFQNSSSSLCWPEQWTHQP